MRIALVTPWAFDDPKAWSGMIPKIHSILSELSDVVPISTTQVRTAVPDRVAARLVGQFSSRNYLWDFGVATSRIRAKALRTMIERVKPDLVLGVVASTDLAFLKSSGIPIVQVSDATLTLMQDFYPMFSDLHPLSTWQANFVSRLSTRKTDGFVVSSNWARNSLISDYQVDPDRCLVAPTGASIVPNGVNARAVRNGAVMQALLVSTDWVRKGGDAAVEAVRLARNSGVEVELCVVGDAPAGLPEWCIRKGRLNNEAMSKAYAEADVLLELATANAGGVTLTDAAAHGLPVIAANVGGVEDIVQHNRTGILLSPNRNLASSAATELRSLADRQYLLREMSAASYEYYRDALDWTHWGSRTMTMCNLALGRGRSE